MPTAAGLRVVVTGAAGAFGVAGVAALQHAGAQVVGIDRRPGDGIVTADLRDAAGTQAAVNEAVHRLGGLDVLVANAGVGDAHNAGAMPDEAATEILDVNLLGVWRATAACLPALRASGGRVVVIASGLAHVTVPFAAAYTASKRAVVGYADTLRLEHGDEVTVTTVYPGYVRTPIHDRPATRGVALEGVIPAEPLERTVAAILRAATGRPRREIATTWSTRAAIAGGRHAPAATDWVLNVWLRRLRRQGRIATTVGEAAPTGTPPATQ